MLPSPHHCTPYIIALFSTPNLPSQVQQMHKIVAQNMNSYSNWKFEFDLKFEWRSEMRQLFRLMQQVLTVTHFRKSRWNCYGFNSIYHGKWYHHFSIFYFLFDLKMYVWNNFYPLFRFLWRREAFIICHRPGV